LWKFIENLILRTTLVSYKLYKKKVTTAPHAVYTKLHSHRGLVHVTHWEAVIRLTCAASNTSPSFYILHMPWPTQVGDTNVPVSFRLCCTTTNFFLNSTLLVMRLELLSHMWIRKLCCWSGMLIFIPLCIMVLFSGGMPHMLPMFFMFQKRALRIMTGTSNRKSCRQLFKTLRILPLQSQHIYSSLCFVVNNTYSYQFISDIHNRNTRQGDNLNIYQS
jgi:hypothetical protein